jgi:hypothetical protein
LKALNSATPGNFNEQSERKNRGEAGQSSFAWFKAISPIAQSSGALVANGSAESLLGMSRETIQRKVQCKELLALPKGKSVVFPIFQFKKGKVLSGVTKVLKELNTDSPFVALSFFLSRGPSFNNMRAIDALQSGLMNEVLAEVRSFLPS